MHVHPTVESFQSKSIYAGLVCPDCPALVFGCSNITTVGGSPDRSLLPSVEPEARSGCEGPEQPRGVEPGEHIGSSITCRPLKEERIHT